MNSTPRGVLTNSLNQTQFPASRETKAKCGNCTNSIQILNNGDLKIERRIERRIGTIDDTNVCLRDTHVCLVRQRTPSYVCILYTEGGNLAMVSEVGGGEVKAVCQ